MINYGDKTLFYINKVFKASDSVLDSDSWEHDKEFQEVLMNTVVGVDGPRRLNRKYSVKSQFITNKLFRPLSEIMTSVQVINNISIYTKSFPYTKQGISRLSFLTYHIENYLNEIYLEVAQQIRTGL